MVFEASLHGAAAALALALALALASQPCCHSSTAASAPADRGATEATDQQVTSEASQIKLTTISSGIEVVGLLAKCIILGLAWPRRSKRSIYKTRPLLYAYDGVHLFNRDSLSLSSF
jgi:hypothetical protein